MKAAEEKIKEFDKKICYLELEELDYDEFYKLIEQAKQLGREAGYNEARRWRSVGEELPQALKRVSVKCRNKRSGVEYVTMAQYVPPKTVLSEDFLDPDCDVSLEEYDEETDCFFAKEGWFEYQTETDINWLITEEVIGFRPIND